MRCSESKNILRDSACRLAKYQFVKDDQCIDYNQWRSHNHANAGDQSDKFGLDTVGICASAKGRVICGCREADACKEAVVGEDGEGVCEEAEDVDEIA